MSCDAALPKPPAEQSASAAWADSSRRYLLLSLYWFPVSLFWGMMLGQILPVRVEDLVGEASKGTYLAVISMIGAVASAGIQLVIGPISDICRAALGRRKPFVLFGTAMGSAAIIAFGWSHSFAALTASFFAVQLALNVAAGPYQALIPDHVAPRNHGKASAFMGLMQLLGEAGGPLIAGLVVANAAFLFGMHGATPASGGPAVAEIERHAARWRLDAFQALLAFCSALLLLCGIANAFTIPDYPSRSDTPVRAALRGALQWDVHDHPDFFRLLVSRGIYSLGFYIALAYVAYYVQDSLGYGTVHYAIPLMLLQVLSIAGALAGTFPAGYLADRGSKKRVVYASCAFSAAAVVAFAFARTPSFAFVMAVAFGIGYGMFRAVDWAFACNLLPQGKGAAKYMAIWSLSATIPQVLAPAFGPVADLVNHRLGRGAGWRAAMLAAALSIVLAALAMRSVREIPLSLDTLNSDVRDATEQPAAASLVS